jgi:hypothetical protein
VGGNIILMVSESDVVIEYSEYGFVGPSGVAD